MILLVSAHTSFWVRGARNEQLKLHGASVVCALFANTVKAKLKAEEFEEELFRGKPVVRNLKNSMAHLFPVQLTRSVEYETEVYEELPDDCVVTNVASKSVMYDAVVYEELLDESMVETVAYEAAVYDEMSVFLAGIVILYLSYADVAKNELPTVENLLPDVAQYELPAVEKLLPDGSPGQASRCRESALCRGH